ncbi:HAD family hydrolase [Candidatus Methylacidithermus pantelleriae]|uniref:HAD family hydrolase n=1 Tax=Candidatus Methylacidithermus pantelleriae TaxID=2744239 RepID=UPI00157D5C33|nr:HAD family phosphatase [Candidatus Methylacidithermus pantelleriae]
MKRRPFLLLDLGQTLVRFDWKEAAQRFTQRTTRPVDLTVEFLCQRCLYVEYELGRVGSREFFFELRRATGFDGTLEEVEEIFCSIFSPWPEREAILAKLLPRFTIAIVSNTSPAHAFYLEKTLPWLSRLPHRFYSFQLGHRKPSSHFYLAVLSQLGCRPWHTILVDDRPENCVGAQKVGIPAVCVSPEECLGEVLARSGLPMVGDLDT